MLVKLAENCLTSEQFRKKTTFYQHFNLIKIEFEGKF